MESINAFIIHRPFQVLNATEYAVRTRLQHCRLIVIEDENLSEESFERLMEIWKKDRIQCTPEEIEELISILIKFQKNRLEEIWKEEEGDLLLGSADFRQTSI